MAKKILVIEDGIKKAIDKLPVTMLESPPLTWANIKAAYTWGKLAGR